MRLEYTSGGRGVASSNLVKNKRWVLKQKIRMVGANRLFCDESWQDGIKSARAKS